MSFAFNEVNEKKFQKLLTQYPEKQAVLLPALWLAQDQHGFLPLDVQSYVADRVGVTAAHVYGVMSFYTMYKEKPVGKYHLQFCKTLSCALCGAETLIQHVEDKLGITHGGVTKDGLFSIEHMECLASCGTAPAMMVNEAYFENLTTDKVDSLLEKLRREA